MLQNLRWDDRLLSDPILFLLLAAAMAVCW
jgi:hypothetical protein